MSTHRFSTGKNRQFVTHLIHESGSCHEQNINLSVGVEGTVVLSAAGLHILIKIDKNQCKILKTEKDNCNLSSHYHSALRNSFSII